MKYIEYAVIPVVVSLLLPLIFRLISMKNRIKEQQMNRNDFAITNPKWLFWTMIALAMIFSIIVCLSNLTEEVELYVNILFISFIILIIICCYALAHMKIIIKNEDIIYYPFIGKKRQINISQIIKVKTVKMSNGSIVYKLYTKEKKFLSITNTSRGCGVLISLLSERNIYFY